MAKLETVTIKESTGIQQTYSQAVIVNSGKLLFIAGQIALDEEGNIIGKNDIIAQARYIFGCLEKILTKAGSSFGQVIKTNYYITDVSDWPKIVEIRSEYFQPVYPASTMVVVKELVKKDLMLEIEAVAVL